MCTNLHKFQAQSEQILTYKSFSRDRHQVHRKQIVGILTSKSGKPLTIEDDYELTAVSCPNWTDSYL